MCRRTTICCLFRVRTPQLLHVSNKCVEFRHPKVMSYDMSGRRHNQQTLSTRSGAMSTRSTRSLAAFFPRIAICRYLPRSRSSFQCCSIILTQAGDVYKCVLVQRTLFHSCSVCACHSQLTAAGAMCKRQPCAPQKKIQKKCVEFQILQFE